MIILGDCIEEMRKMEANSVDTIITDETKDFVSWFNSRGKFYSKLPLKHYMDGEPYFSSQGVECSLRDYQRVKSEVSDIFTCKYISGGGTEYDGGLWRRKETPKTITFTQIKESFYNPNWTVLKISKDVKKNKRHCLRDWEDGTYTIYPDQCGTPHIFESIVPDQIESIYNLLQEATPDKLL